MSDLVRIAVAFGDGIGPEIMDATLFILKEAKAKIAIETIQIGEECYTKGYSNGIPPQAWKTIEQTKILLKAPITTPQGGGYKSLNVTLRRALGLYANVRPSISYHPFVATHHPKMDMVIVRENEEDLYTGIEYRQTQHAFQSLKLITREGSERIIRYAFDYAVRNNRKKVTCMSKDNIMKMADGLFHKVFDEVAKEYPQIENSHMIVDIGAARIASRPESFDVVVTLNLYGDIISDIAADVSGSVGLAGSANIGREYTMFEAVHGSAPDIAGKNIANPSGLLNGAIMMLVHIGQADIATLVHNAWSKTLEDGIHTGDIYNEKHSKQKVGTKEFAESVVARLGQKPTTLPVADYKAPDAKKAEKAGSVVTQKKQLVGVDVYLDYRDGKPGMIADQVQAAATGALKLQLISTRGMKVWPGNSDGVNIGDHWCLRFLPEGEKKTNVESIVELLQSLHAKGLEFIKTEHLYTFDDQLGFTLAQGE